MISALVSSMLRYVHRDHTGNLLGSGEPRTSSPTFTQLLSSEDLSVSQFNVALRPQRPYGLLGTWSPGRPPRLPHSYYPYAPRARGPHSLFGDNSAFNKSNKSNITIIVTAVRSTARYLAAICNNSYVCIRPQ